MTRNPNNLPVLKFDIKCAPLGISPSISIINLKDLWKKALKILPESFSLVERRMIRVWTDQQVPIMLSKGERAFGMGEVEMLIEFNPAYEGNNSRTFEVLFTGPNIRTKYCESEFE